MDRIPTSFMNEPVFMSLEEKAKVAVLSPEEKRAYDQSLKTYRDNMAVMECKYYEGVRDEHKRMTKELNAREEAFNAERERLLKEKDEERHRLLKEKEEERQRLLKEKEEERQRLLKEKEEERQKWIKSMVDGMEAAGLSPAEISIALAKFEQNYGNQKS